MTTKQVSMPSTAVSEVGGTPGLALARAWLPAAQFTLMTSANTIGFGAEMLNAMVMSGRISARGALALRDASLRIVQMSVSDGTAAARALMLQAGDGKRVEVELVRHPLSRGVSRGTILPIMAMQVLEDATYPLVRRMDVVFERLCAAASA